MSTPRFTVGDVINSSISSPKVVEEIRIGTPLDFVTRPWIASHAGELCYVLRFLKGKQNCCVYSVASVDSDHHLRGTKMYEEYEAMRASV